MDLETENRLAALLMEEARKARIQADKEGVHAYLQNPNVRARPNSRFLTATVLGVQQANRVVEVSEMWNAREKELELDAKLKSRSKSPSIHNDQRSHQDSLRICSSSRHKGGSRNSNSPSSQRVYEHFDFDDNSGLKDEEVEEFLRARAKRGRGAIGSRMDEPGPYMSPGPSGQATVNPEMRVKEEWERRILGPEKPSFMKSKSSEYVSEDSDDHENSKRHRSEHKRSKKEKEGKAEHKRSKKEKEGKAAREAKSSKHRHKRGRKE